MKKSDIIYLVLGLYVLGIISVFTLLIVKKPLVSQQQATPLGNMSAVSKDAIAIVEVVGPIRMSQSSGGFMNNDAGGIVKKLRELGKRQEIKAIVLRINSPGGSVAATQEIYYEIMKLRKENKIIVASMVDVAASGGYYIASACNKIVADPGTLTGSIGVILEIGNVEELFKKIGVKMEAIKSGKHKDSGSMFRSLTADERKMFQELIDTAYLQFVDAIVEGRKMDRQKVLDLADGRVFIGTQALNLGLIDKIGNNQTAIQIAKELSGIKGEPKIISDTDKWERLLSMFTNVESKMPFADIVTKNKVRFEYMLE